VAPRAIWKGHLKIAELSCPVALYAAASTSDRVSFRTLNRATGNPVRREYVDVETGEPVDKEHQVKGFEIAKGEYVTLTPEEVAAAVPESDKTLTVEGFLDCSEIETRYFDRPYYIGPAGPHAEDAFALIRDGMRAKKAAALARAVLFRRVRSVLIRAQSSGLVANTLDFDYEVRSARDTFRDIPDISIEKEMLDLARHIIATKRGDFDPSTFDDRYDAALAELVRAKAEGREIEAPKPRPEPKVVSLMDALRESAEAAGKGPADAGEQKRAPKSGKGRASKKPAPAKRKGEAAGRRKAG
jgi:DNA end-binding protein Ku